MLAVYKEDEITSADFDEARGIVKAGLASLIGKEPEPKVIALVLAKITLESGRSGLTLLTSCHDGNVGNIKAAFDYDGMFTLYPCNEIIGGHAVWFRPEGRLDKKGGSVVSELHLLPPEGDGHPQCRFRAYANVVDGIYEYLDFIWREKYRDARAELLLGDPHGYVHALKLKGYFTADEELYGRGVMGLFTEFLARLEGRPAPLMPSPDVAHLLASQPFNMTAVTASLNAAFAGREQQIVVDNFKDDFSEEEPDTAVTQPKGQPNS